MTRSSRAWLVLVLLSLVLVAPTAAQAEDFKVQLVRIDTPTPASKQLVQTLGLDLAEGGGPAHMEAVLWDAEDAGQLTKAGLRYRTKIADLAANTRANERQNRAFAASVERSAFPSGSTDYRTLDEINKELEQLAAENPGMTRLFEMPEKSVQGRPILGLEIAQDVKANDGRPVFLQLGVHHAREWPSAEHVLEWGYEMINGTKSGDARASRLTKDIRTIIVPVVNPDGFDISRDFGPVDNPDGGIVEAYAYKRKNCNVPAGPEACVAQPALGTDPNRNYGGLWGGPGASTNPAEADYRGPGPFSEPETRNVQKLVSTRHVTTLITNHTYTGLVLRPPGVAAQGPSVDETVYKALGDAMGAKNGYISQLSFNLYDTTGTTEDWSYYATGGLGFTFEIGPTEFHPPYEEVVQEWEGTGQLGKMAKEGGGNREAYYVAAESTANDARHSVIEGKAPAGTVLRLKKEFMTKTSPVIDESGNEGDVQEFKDTLDTSIEVPASGAFEWDINPSTRPAVAPKAGRAPTGPPSEAFELDNPPVPPGSAVEIPFTYTREEGRDDETMTVEVTNPAPVEDYDIAVFRADENGEKEGDQLASSAQFVNNREAAIIRTPEPGDYILEVTNFAATGITYSARVLFGGPTPPTEGKTETWTLTCERPDGTVLATQELFIARGERKAVEPCPRGAGGTPGTGAGAGTGGPGNGSAGQPGTTTPGTGGGGGGGGTAACQSRTGFISASARGAGRSGGVEFGFRRRVDAPVTVDVFRQSVGRRVIGERLVRRFTNRTSGFTWDGRDARGRKVGSGYYFARYRIKAPGGASDTVRITLGRSSGRFGPRRAFYRRDSCGTLGKFKLSRPVFGGPERRALGIAYKLNQAGRVTVEVANRRGRVVRRFAARNVPAGRTQRLTLPVRGLARGDHRVRLSVATGGRTTTSTLTARKL